LERIGDALGMVNEYLEDLTDGLRMHPGEWVSTYIAKAEGLIELLEIHDCGSVGGFDSEVGGDSMHGLLYLEQRFEALKCKYGSKMRKKKKKSRGA
jgi:hypothetical protein